MSTRIILARHGESVVNVVGLASDDLEGNPLTYLGQTQAHALGPFTAHRRAHGRRDQPRAACA